ncbi:hypothetical protein ACX818_001253 [Acinetobacter baumannii]
MKEINLDILPKCKQITINGKTINVPKLGLKHRLVYKDGQSHEEFMKSLMASIHPNLSMAERDLLTLHLMEYNGKLKNSIEISGESYSIDDVYICQKLKFNYGEFEFKFRSPTLELMDGPLDILLNRCCVSAKYKGEKIDVPDFMDLPPFVSKWAEDITNTVALDTKTGKIVGLYKLVELFSE